MTTTNGKAMTVEARDHDGNLIDGAAKPRDAAIVRRPQHPGVGKPEKSLYQGILSMAITGPGRFRHRLRSRSWNDLLQ